MDPEHVNSDIPAPHTAEQGPLDPAALVDQMVAAGEWPEPELMERIVQAGDAVVKPLIAFLRTYPRGWPAEAPLYHAIGLLSMLRPPKAIPELIEIVKRYGSDSGELAGRAVAEFGAVGFEPLLEVLRDPEIRGYKRRHAIEAARVAAGDDPTLRARLAEVLRFFLANAIERGREETRQWKMRRELEESSAGADLEAIRSDESETVPEDSAAPSSGDGPTGNEDEVKLYIHEEIALLVDDLALLADPSARKLIKTAFDEDLVDTSLIDQEAVEELYGQGGEPALPAQDWLGFYREQYQEHINFLNRPPTPPMIQARLPARASSEPEPASPPPAPAMIRNVGPKLGRNDPCWCGSGKKYKKCHLGKDGFR
jgi:SEC-C motif